MITIRPASAGELDAIWALVTRAVTHMNALGNPQWGEDYPTPDFYQADLRRGELFAAEVDAALAGVACLNTEEAPEYAPLPWTSASPAMVIHRMAVDPVFQREGVGSSFFAFAEAEARRRGLRAIRLDTYSKNGRMQALIRKMGFRQVGEIRLHGRPLPFPCFEKALF